MDCSTPSLLVSHHLLEFAQIHVHWISDAIQPSHPRKWSYLFVHLLIVSVLFSGGGKKFFLYPLRFMLGSWKLNWWNDWQEKKVYFICIWEDLKKWSKNPKEAVRSRGFKYHFNRIVNVQNSDKKKGRGSRCLRAQIVRYMGEANGR